MAAVNPRVIWKGHSFDWYAGTNFEKFLGKILKDAEAHASLPIKNGIQGQMTDQDFINETGIDDINDLSSLPGSEHSPHESCSSSGKVKLFRQIFADHFHELSDTPLRSVVIENVERMLSCGDPKKGGTMYGCPTCDTLRFSPCHCGSRFCPSCGNLYNSKRAQAMAEKVIDAPHRHITFTIPAEFRDFFRLDRTTLNDLFDAVSDTLFYVFRNLSKTEKFIPGFIAVLHTFGRDLKWNPHIHVLLCEILVGSHRTHFPITYINYASLRKSFQKTISDRLSSRFGKRIRRLVSKLYKKYCHGFYVHAPQRKCNIRNTIKYIGRYLGRPPIASSRIDSYDGKTVTFHYTRHEDNKTVSESTSAIDFIKKLIVHIPDKNFKMVRYFGFYSSESARICSLRGAHLSPLIKKSSRAALRKNNTWRFAMMQAFNIDPIKCPYCGDTMKPIYFSCGEKTHFFPVFKLKASPDIRMLQLLSFTSSA